MKRNGYSRNLCVLVLLVLTALAVPGAPLWAEEIKTPAAAPEATSEEKPTGDFTAAVLSQYIWRGYELSRNSVVIQPSMTIGYKGFTANLWGNLDTKPYFAGTGDTNYSNTLNETDLIVSYNKTLGLFTVGGGYIYYALGSLNKDAPKRSDSQEFFVTASLNTLLSPTLTVYKEIDRYKQWYFLLGISHTFELNKAASLKLGASASYLLSTYADAALFNAGSGYGGYPKFGGNSLATDDKFSNLHDGVISVSFPVKATGNITVTPAISYIFPLSGDAKDEMKGQGLKGSATPTERDNSFFVGGVSLSFSF
ncbi:hypothetical protein D4R89_13725 [bacterium]|nr:MAG: hypothetical protein D4R89_13725 [bacterium]